MRKVLPLKLKVVSLKDQEIPDSISIPHGGSANKPLVLESKFQNRFKQQDRGWQKQEYQSDLKKFIIEKKVNTCKSHTGTTADTVPSEHSSPQSFSKEAQDQVPSLKLSHNRPIKLVPSCGDEDNITNTNFSGFKRRPLQLENDTEKESMQVLAVREESFDCDSPTKQEAFLFQLYAKISAPKEEPSLPQDMSPRCSLDYQLARGIYGTNTSSDFARTLSPGLRPRASMDSPKISSKRGGTSKKNKPLLRLKTVKEMEECNRLEEYQDDSYSSGLISDS